METFEKLMVISKLNWLFNRKCYFSFLKIKDNIIVITNNGSYILYVDKAFFKFLNKHFSKGCTIEHLSEDGKKIFANTQVVKKHFAKKKANENS